MKRRFEITCTKNNKNLVKTVVNDFNGYGPMGRVSVEDEPGKGTVIRFKCTRNKLKECRLLLGKMLNDGLLLSTVEIW
jgi:hypothetical protein